MNDELKKEWLKKLRNINSAWQDGDSEEGKTADLINVRLKVAIELKNDGRNYKKQDISQNILRNQFQDDARSANEKFKNYPEYKTVLLIKSLNLEPFFKLELGRIFLGRQEIISIGHNHANLSELKDKFFSPSNTEIGAYVFYGKQYFYLGNPVAKASRILTIEKAKEFLAISEIETLSIPQSIF